MFMFVKLILEGMCMLILYLICVGVIVVIDFYKCVFNVIE